MKRISVTGWVPAKQKENVTLDYCNLRTQLLREEMKFGVAQKRGDVEGPAKKVRVTCVIDVETLARSTTST